MSSFKKIMAAIDLSEYSLPALLKAVELAEALKAELVLVNVINQRDIDNITRTLSAYQAFSIDSWLEDQERAREEGMRTLIAAAACAHLKPKTIIRVGYPYEKLLEVIEAEQADLLVMSTKGRSNLADTVIGSCAQKMYRRSPIPMLSVRAKGIPVKVK
ncbi:MAG: universal stress protein [Desulfobacterales bacterium]|jgi:nucleotide-binding universal stress UspA family protein